MHAIVFLPKDTVVNLFNVNTSNLNANKFVKASKATDNTLRLIERVGKRKQELIKEKFTLDKFLNAIYELNMTSEQVLKYFFM